MAVEGGADALVQPEIIERPGDALISEVSESAEEPVEETAEEAVEEARSHVANLVGCDPREIVWTSGATEADNLAVKGIARFYKTKGNHIITSKIEHKHKNNTQKILDFL